MWIDKKTGNGYNFYALSNPEDKEVTNIPFPVATPAQMESDNISVCGAINVLKLTNENTAQSKEFKINKVGNIQPGSQLFIDNSTPENIFINGVCCYPDVITNLVFNGAEFVSSGGTNQEPQPGKVENGEIKVYNHVNAVTIEPTTEATIKLTGENLIKAGALVMVTNAGTASVIIAGTTVQRDNISTFMFNGVAFFCLGHTSRL